MAIKTGYLYETPDTFIHSCFSFKGRLNRARFWIYGLFSTISMLGIGLLSFLGGAFFRLIFGLFLDDNAAEGIGVGIGLTCFVIGSNWIQLAVVIKRLHDMDYTWAPVLIYLIPILGWIILTIALGFSKGTDGPNQFGKDRLKLYSEQDNFMIEYS